MIPGVFAAAVTGATADAGDPYWSNVVSLLHFDGADNSTTITDEIPRTWTVNGNARLRTEQRKWGPSSLYLDGSGDYLSTPNSPGLTLAGTDATIECWVRPETLSRHMNIASKRPTSADSEFIFYISGGEVRVVAWNNGSVVVEANGGVQLSENTWHHVALSVVGNVWRIFVDGVLSATDTASGAVQGNSDPIFIGRDRSTSSRDFLGYIDDFRWTAGIGRYTESFTPPDGPFPDDPSIVRSLWVGAQT